MKNMKVKHYLYSKKSFVFSSLTSCPSWLNYLFYFETFAREYGERKISIFLSIFLKNLVNSRAIEQIFRGNRQKSNHFYSSYLSCKGLILSIRSLNYHSGA